MAFIFRKVNTIEEKRRQYVDQDHNRNNGQKSEKGASFELFALYIDILAHNVPIYHLRLNKTKRVAYRKMNITLQK